MSVQVDIYIRYFRNSARGRRYQLGKRARGNRNTFKALFIGEALAYNTIGEAPSIDKDSNKINPIYPYRYNKRFSIYSLLSYCLVLNSPFSLLSTTSGRS